MPWSPLSAADRGVPRLPQPWRRLSTEPPLISARRERPAGDEQRAHEARDDEAAEGVLVSVLLLLPGGQEERRQESAEPAGSSDYTDGGARAARGLPRHELEARPGGSPERAG